ncbi:hypothetical protein LOTGIDRAFT_230453 [Lottia gigantea]|uniref:Uncharacterized protein n=1 Tax=Lottia gigantea TaxID=225164 RepID=V4AZ39_LOTGI|nr:hypothetical protein LOTGIDRAFT_230453 [Lottia gigantea]ESP02998.1 hypothetical protein LOTGIDRAFT_230453 [Lottia gigantea]
MHSSLTNPPKEKYPRTFSEAVISEWFSKTMAIFKKVVRYKFIIGLLMSFICIQHFRGFTKEPLESNRLYHIRYTRKEDELCVLFNQPMEVFSEIKKFAGIHQVYQAYHERSVESKINSILTAIEHGTSWIYYSSITEDINPILQKFNFQPESSGMIYTGPSKSTVDFHFIPRDFNPKSDYKRQYMYSKYPTSLIQTIFKATSDKGNIDYKAPHITVSTKTLPYFNQVNTLYSYSTFWALIPLDIHPYILSIWTGKLLELLDNYITYYSPLSSTSLSYLHYPLNSDIYTQLSLLQSWQCDDKLTFFTCLIDWSEYLKERDILSAKQVEFIYKWMAQLAISGYTEPSRNYNKQGMIPINAARFWPSRGPASVKDIKTVFNGTCSKFKNGCDAVPSGKMVFNDILLIININMPGFYKVIDTTETIYKSHFPQRLYCGSNMTDFVLTLPNLKNKDVTFLDTDFFHGMFAYRCVERAYKMGYKFQGVLSIMDDLVLNIWNLKHLPLNRFWFQKNMRVAQLGSQNVTDIADGPFWKPWMYTVGGRTTELHINKLKEYSKENTKYKKTIDAFLQTLAKNAGGKDKVFYECSDFYYVPLKHMEKFAFIANLWTDSRMHLEIFIPTVFNAIVPQNEIVKVSGTYLWKTDRLRFKDYYKQSDTFLHPLKLSRCAQNPKCYTFFCEKYLSCWKKM